MSGDEISLTLPADDAFHRVAHLVMGGLAVRLDLTFEHLEDLELALDALLERFADADEVTLRVRLSDGELRTVVGPFRGVRADLEQGEEGVLDLHRILRTVCDSVGISERDGLEWVELTKRVESARAAS